jgi:hypothetical protein
MVQKERARTASHVVTAIFITAFLLSVVSNAQTTSTDPVSAWWDRELRKIKPPRASKRVPWKPKLDGYNATAVDWVSMQCTVHSVMGALTYVMHAHRRDVRRFVLSH